MSEDSFPAKLKADLAAKGVDVSLDTPMSEEELAKVRDSIANADLKDRFKHLDEQAAKMKADHETLVKSYHHSKEDDLKADRAGAAERAQEERKPAVLDPLELMRQVQIMREEGVSDDVIRAAFQEVMEGLSGKSTRDHRRITRTEGMTKMLTQPEINALYEDRHKKVLEMTTLHPDMNLLIQAVKDGLKAREQAARPTFKNYAYRVAKFFIAPILQGLIYVLNALGVK